MVSAIKHSTAQHGPVWSTTSVRHSLFSCPARNIYKRKVCFLSHLSIFDLQRWSSDPLKSVLTEIRTQCACHSSLVLQYYFTKSVYVACSSSLWNEIQTVILTQKLSSICLFYTHVRNTLHSNEVLISISDQNQSPPFFCLLFWIIICHAVLWNIF